ncbi:hypothetical protein Mterra_01600 [Calidithermus terrae]|uniref:Uncharacterized protein n=1 Tax=Calidithermus terrae TaxID=1408545 RepID=A0A399EQK9_9DEIN|nr:hypothetical protein [Calidithermus terrae]RIH85843.1 hypothetical protein Mterra_01600 [Calidithermus terrae]
MIYWPSPKPRKSLIYQIFATVLALIISVPFGLAGATASQHQKLLVTDYFKLLPDSYLPLLPSQVRNALVKGVQQSQKNEWFLNGKTYWIDIDTTNEYLRVRSTAFEGFIEVAVWRAKGQLPLIGVTTVGCGPVCRNESLHFLKMRSNGWIEVTSSVLPKIDASMMLDAYRRHKKPDDEEFKLNDINVSPFFVFPRIGTTIQVRTLTGVRVFDLLWINGQFKIQAPKP